MLDNKIALVFAASGAIAGQVARSFAEAGAHVFVSARRADAVQALAKEITAAGGKAEAAVVDAQNETEVDQYLDQIFAAHGRIDIVFNGIGRDPDKVGYAVPSTLLPFEQFMEPMEAMVGSQFITSRIAAGKMVAHGKPGTILLLTASLSRIKAPCMAGITAACAAIEGLTRSLAGEFGMHGIRVHCLNSTALMETPTIQKTSAAQARLANIPAEAMREQMQQGFLLGRGPSLEDVGRAATLLVSDAGIVFNSHIVDVDCGNAGVI